MPEIITIPTERPDVVLQSRSIADDQAFADSYTASRDTIGLFEPLDHIRTATQAAIDRMSSIQVGKHKISVLEAGVFVGCITYMPRGDKEAELGGWIDSNHVQKGIATTAIRAFTGYALERHEMVFGRVKPDNVGSARVLQKAGFTLRVPGADWHIYRRYAPFCEPVNLNDPNNQRAFY